MREKKLRNLYQGDITTRPPNVAWDLLWEEFAAELEASARSERTLEAYRLASDQLRRFMVDLGLPEDPSIVTAEHVRHYLRAIQKEVAPATANQRYRSLSRFFGWLRVQGEIRENPIARISPPRVPKRMVMALRSDEVRALLSACNLKTKLGVRDYAIIMALYDTGLRASEFLSMEIDNSGKYDYVRVVGKGNKERAVRLGIKARQAVLKYIRIWRLPGPTLWVSNRGAPLNRHSLHKLVQRVGRQASLKVWPHLMRHTFATAMHETDAPRDAIRALGGWESDDMLRNYSRSREMDRALEVHKKFSPGDRL